MLLYIHFPFCQTRCHYCAFSSTAIGKGKDIGKSEVFRNYIDTLFLELAYWADKYPQQKISSIFFGGGTPSLMPVQILSILMGRIHKYFKVDATAEITLEANPESLSSSRKVRQFMDIGINRLSIGVQSLDDEYLKIIGRSHKSYDAVHAYYAARDAGMANVNLDIMWGLPKQGVRHWIRSLKEILALKPDHISSYGLTIERGTPLELDYNSGLIDIPPERDQSLMFMEGAELMESAGYIHYEISSFSRMGFQCIHNVGYWEGKDYLGVGPSATSTILGRRWTNPSSQKVWAKKVNEQNLDAQAEELTPYIRVLELIMLRLRTSRGLRVKAYKELTGRDFLKDNQQMMQVLHENGLIRIRDGYLRLTRSGMLVSNCILANIFEKTEEQLKSLVESSQDVLVGSRE